MICKDTTNRYRHAYYVPEYICSNISAIYATGIAASSRTHGHDRIEISCLWVWKFYTCAIGGRCALEAKVNSFRPTWTPVQMKLLIDRIPPSTSTTPGRHACAGAGAGNTSSNKKDTVALNTYIYASYVTDLPLVLLATLSVACSHQCNH